MIALTDRPFLLRLQLEKDVTGKQWFPKHNRLAAILMGRIVTRQRRGEALPLTILDQFLFATGLGVSDKPLKFRHGLKVRKP